MKLNKFHLRRFIASLIASPILAGLYLAMWFLLTMLGAGGNYEMAMNAVPSILVVWVLLFTFWTEFYNFVERVTGVEN
jgi:hypothetical protein